MVLGVPSEAVFGTHYPSFAEATEGIHCLITDPAKDGGARRDRTDDLLNANQALFQLSYGPIWSKY
jgi:hypothetical protein